MAVKKTGLEAVVENLGKFIADVGKINSATASIGNQISVTSKGISVFGYTFSSALNRFVDAKHKIVSFQTVTNALAQNLNQISGASNSAASSVGIIGQAFAGMTTQAETADAELKKKPGDMKAAEEATVTLAQRLATLGGQFLAVAGQALAFSGGILNTLVGGIVRLGEAVLRTASNFTQFWRDVGKVAIGFTIGNIVNKIASEVKELGMEIIKTAGLFQLLEIRMRTIAARDLSKSLGKPIEDVREQAQGLADTMLEWVRTIAIATRFSTTEVAKSLALANAYGIQAKAATTLTEATLDFAAAMGLNEDHIYRIIYNFGQMQQQGKLTGREFRDLAISFVPVHDVLAEMADDVGMTAQAMEELALKGGVPVEAFFRKFVDMVERDFKGAARESIKTIDGLIDQIKDFAKITLGVDVLGPTIDTIVGSLVDVVNSLNTKEFRNVAKVIGGVLNDSLLLVGKSIKFFLLPALQDMFAFFGIGAITMDKFALKIAELGFGAQYAIFKISEVVNWITGLLQNTLGKVQGDGHTWGYNLIANFAKGMAAAIKLIAKVIMGVVNLISTWFHPGSPPKIAKDIDEWGTDMIDEWAKGFKDGKRFVTSGIQSLADPLAASTVDAGKDAAKKGALAFAQDFHKQAVEAVGGLVSNFGGNVMAGIMGGFGKADFSMFETLTDTATGFLRSLSTRVIGEEGIVPRILGTRKSIAEAIEGLRSGATSVSDAFAKISKSMGNVPIGMKDYIQNLLLAESAQSNFDNAQKISLETLEKADDVLAKLSGSVKDNAMAYVEALTDLKTAEEQNAVAEETLTRITNKYEKQLKALKDQLTSVTDVYDEQRQLKEIDAALSSGLLTDEEEERLQMEKKAILLKAQIRDTEAKRDAEVDAAKKNVEATKDAVSKAKEEADKKKQAMDDVASAQLEMAQAQVEASRSLIDVQTQQNELIQEQIDLYEKLAEKASGAGESDLTGLEGLGDLGNLGDLGLMTPEEIQAKVDAIMKDAEKRFYEWKDRMKNAIAAAFGYESWDAMAKDFEAKVTKPIETAFTNFSGWWNEKASPLFSQFLSVVGGTFSILGETIADFGKKLGVAIGPLDVVTLALGVLLALIAGPLVIAGSILNGVITAVSWAIDFATKTIQFFQPFFIELVRIWNEASAAFQNATSPLEKVITFLQLLAVTIVGSVVFAVGVIFEVISTVFMAILGVVMGFVKGFIGFFVDLWNRLVHNSIVPEMMAEIQTCISDVMNAILTFIGDILGSIAKFFLDRFTEASNTVRDKLEQARAWASSKMGELKGVIDTAMAEVKKIWDEKWDAIWKKANEIWNDKDGIVYKVRKGIEDLATDIRTTAKKAIDDLGGYLKDLETKFYSVRDAILAVIRTIGDWIAQTLSKAFQMAKDAYDFVTGHSPSPLAIGLGYANKELKDMIRNVNKLNAVEFRQDRVSSPSRFGNNVNNSRNVTIQVDANYANTQSPVGIYYDVSAALQSAKL